MKQGPDLIVILIIVFVVGFAITTVSQSDLEFTTALSQAVQ